MKGDRVPDAQEEEKLPGLQAAPATPILTDPTDPGEPLSLHGLLANGSGNSRVHSGFLLDEMGALTEVSMGTALPHHVVMKENTQPFQ